MIHIIHAHTLLRTHTYAYTTRKNTYRTYTLSELHTHKSMNAHPPLHAHA